VDWETNGGPLSRSYSPARVPGNDWLYTHALSVLVAFMAREKINNLYQGQDALMAALYLHHASRASRLGLTFDDYIAERVAIKGRQFNTILNAPDPNDALDAEALERQARESRKGAKGGA
jgi:hypothetical protein